MTKKRGGGSKKSDANKISIRSRLIAPKWGLRLYTGCSDGAQPRLYISFFLYELILVAFRPRSAGGGKLKEQYRLDNDLMQRSLIRQDNGTV